MPACLSLRGLKSQPGRRARAQGWLQAAIDNYVISPHQVVDDRPLARPCNLLCNHHFPLLPLLCHTQGNGKTYINTRQIFAFVSLKKKLVLWSLWVSCWITACEIAATFLFLVVINGITLGHFLWLLWFNSLIILITTFAYFDYHSLSLC